MQPVLSTPLTSPMMAKLERTQRTTAKTGPNKRMMGSTKTLHEQQ